jgi:hypothetical protein
MKASILQVSPMRTERGKDEDRYSADISRHIGLKKPAVARSGLSRLPQFGPEHGGSIDARLMATR